MKFDLNSVLDCVGLSETKTVDIDLNDFHYRGVSPFNTPAKLSALATNRAGVVTLDLDYTYTLNLSCDRCLNEFKSDVSQKATHTVVRNLNGVDDDDFVVVPDGIVELLPLATNDIILSLPSKFLCQDECKGLCAVCGANKNSTTCNCTTKTLDPRLSALDKFFEE